MGSTIRPGVTRGGRLTRWQTRSRADSAVRRGLFTWTRRVNGAVRLPRRIRWSDVGSWTTRIDWRALGRRCAGDSGSTYG